MIPKAPGLSLRGVVPKNAVGVLKVLVEECEVERPSSYDIVFFNPLMALAFKGIVFKREHVS